MSGAGTGAGHWTGCQQADTCTLLISNFQTVSDISSHNVWHGMCHCDLCHYYQCFFNAVISLYSVFSGYDNVNTNTSSNVDLYKLNVKVEAAGQDGPN